MAATRSLVRAALLFGAAVTVSAQNATSNTTTAPSPPPSPPPLPRVPSTVKASATQTLSGTVESFNENKTVYIETVLKVINQTDVSITNFKAVSGSVVLTYDIVFSNSPGYVIYNGTEMNFQDFFAKIAPEIDEAVASVLGVTVEGGFKIVKIVQIFPNPDGHKTCE